VSAILSPDGKYSVVKQDDFDEIAMGSPQFGHVSISGAKGQIPNDEYGEVILWSPDSRFVALEALVEVRPTFRTKLVVVEMPRCVVFTVRVQSQGTVTPVRWEGSTRLIYTTWSVGVPRENFEWDAPSF